MRWTIIGLLSLVVLITQTSCGQASFSGNSGGSNNPPPASTPTTPTNGTNNPGPTSPVPGANPNGTPGNTTPGGTTGTNPGTTPPSSSTNGGVIPPGGGPAPAVPQCNGNPCIPTNSAPTYGPVGQIQQPTPNSVVFGTPNSEFHLGNNQYSSTSCMAKVSAIPVSGKAYFFQFQVAQDNTSVMINVASICGSDYVTDMIQLTSGATQIGSLPIPVNATTLGMPSAVLNHGVYTVYIVPGHGDGTTHPTWDIDDFVVSQVQVSGNQPIQPLNYGAF